MPDDKLLKALEDRDYKAIDRLIAEDPGRAKEVLPLLKSIRAYSRYRDLVGAGSPEPLKGIIGLRLVRDVLEVISGDMDYSFAAQPAVRGAGADEHKSLKLPFGTLTVLSAGSVLLSVSVPFRRCRISLDGEEQARYTNSIECSQNLGVGSYMLEIDDDSWEINLSSAEEDA